MIWVCSASLVDSPSLVQALLLHSSSSWNGSKTQKPHACLHVTLHTFKTLSLNGMTFSLALSLSRSLALSLSRQSLTTIVRRHSSLLKDPTERPSATALKSHPFITTYMHHEANAARWVRKLIRKRLLKTSGAGEDNVTPDTPTTPSTPPSILIAQNAASTSSVAATATTSAVAPTSDATVPHGST
jgi:hypothetical protein